MRHHLDYEERESRTREEANKGHGCSFFLVFGFLFLVYILVHTYMRVCVLLVIIHSSLKATRPCVFADSSENM